MAEFGTFDREVVYKLLRETDPDKLEKRCGEAIEELEGLVGLEEGVEFACFTTAFAAFYEARAANLRLKQLEERLESCLKPVKPKTRKS